MLLARLEDPITNSLKAEGGPAPNAMDCSSIIPTWDINQSGMLDPKYKEDEQDSGSGPLPFAPFRNGFSQPMIASGTLAGVSNASAPLIAPQGIALGGTMLASVNSQYTRTQNGKFIASNASIDFDAAGAAAFAGKTIISTIFMLYAPTIGGLNLKIIVNRQTATVGAATNYPFHFFSETGILVPWDCVLYQRFNSADFSFFPANTTAAIEAIGYIRSKNSMLPQW